MLIAVDIGNTDIVLGFLEGTKIIASYRMTTLLSHTSDEYGLMLSEFLQMSNYADSDVDDVIISSVVPNVMHSFRAAIIKFFGVDPIVVGPGIKTGINIRLDDPRSLGADCLCDCVGAFGLYGGPLLVLDFGTATTYNYVDAKGTITAGLITVGIRSGAAALSNKTAQLPEVEITRPKSVFATDTKTAMQAGLFYNFLGGVERTIVQFQREVGESFKVVATGGFGRIIEGETDSIDVYDPNLIFKGMRMIYDKNISR
ncbi:type III pantothenate kinase [Bifidobacterium aquikefiri]|uniref:Type III pantothenate kinase n=1 Tax=Bifidobacterium aquikefiri TaxID=1653207 RepID=A0A261G6R8_9BIFI|nr:type III pantothenate kinase [Bifidobacterium aquikefiri]OZG67137.1 type III pantothenate kinase [Bifidobacterium aquikefiri]